MALFLFLDSFGQHLHQPFEAAHGFNLRFFFIGEEFLGKFLEPLGGDVGVKSALNALQALEDMAKHPVELVDVLLVFHEGRARQVVEVIHRPVDDCLVERLHEHEVFFQRYGKLGFAQLCEEAAEHG